MRDSLNPRENTQHYTIIGDDFKFASGCAKFIYKGYEISFTTNGYQEGSCLKEVAIFREGENKPLHEVYTVEEAIQCVEGNIIRERVRKSFQNA